MKISSFILFCILYIQITIVTPQQIRPVIPSGHRTAVNSIDVGPQGNYLITGSHDHTIVLWDIATGIQIRTFSGHNGSVESVCFSKDGKTFISGSTDNTIKLWDIEKEDAIRTFSGHIGWVTSVGFSQQCDSILSCSWDKSIKLWETNTSKLIHTYLGHTENIEEVKFIQNDSIIISGGWDEELFVWDTKNRKIISRIKPDDNNILTLEYDPIHGTTYIGDYDGHLYSYDHYSKQTTSPLEKLITVIGDIKLSPGKNYLAFAGGVYENDMDLYPVCLYSLQTKQLYKSFSANKGSINSLHYLNNDKYLFSGGNDAATYLWDIESEEQLRAFKGYTSMISSVQYSENMNYLLASTWKKKIHVWDLSIGKQIITIDGVACCFSNDNRYVVSGDMNGLVTITDIQTGEINQQFKAHDGGIIALNITEDNNLLFTSGNDLKLKVWDLQTRKVIKKLNYIFTFNSNNKGFTSIAISKDNTLALTGNIDNNIYVFDIKKQRKTATLKAHTAEVTAVSISPDNVYAASGGFDNHVILWDLKEKAPAYWFKGHSGPIHSVEFSPDGRFLVSGSDDQTIKIWDIQTGNIHTTISGHSRGVSSVSWSPDGKHILSGSFDTSVKLWDPKTGKEEFTLMSLNEKDWVILAPDNYYMCTKDAAKAMGYTDGQKTFGFEQFDFVYNRPDIILSRLGKPDSKRIMLYEMAHKKRLEKYGYSQQNANINGQALPEISLLNRHELPYSTAKDSIMLDIYAKDKHYHLHSIKIWINGVPLFGENGISLKNSSQSSYSGKIPIALSKGKNKVQLAAVNEIGLESYKKTQFIQFTGKRVLPDLYLIGIGISLYKDSAYNLTYAKKDARDFLHVMSKHKEGYNKVHTVGIFDSEATRHNINLIKEKLLHSKVDDEIIVFIAGHGLLDVQLDYYLATYDVDFLNPSGKGLPFFELEQILDSIPARKKLLLIDACHSGEVDKDEMLVSSNKIEDENISFRGFSHLKPVNSGSGTKNSFEIMKELFTDLRRGSGTIIVSSAGGAEYAFESPEWNNGVFTYALLTGLKTLQADLNNDGKIKVSEIRDYVYNKVQKLTKGKQSPTARQENLEYDFVVW